MGQSNHLITTNKKIYENFKREVYIFHLFDLNYGKNIHNILSQ